ncbi:ATP-binding protein [Effusibacillus consociatus]|uniref:ATP-binding protein n=1 Tax=Effusibacillus consociatus TaxID=1117041 RepID=A0ABV9PVD3_9BACL
MRIDRLEIHGFGKYQNYTLDLKDGLQVIYGPNEAGKTTLQSFVLAMLFGMKKPGKKRTVYTEEHSRYMPWQGEVYGGVLECTINGQSYRIERSFLKNREDCRIYLAHTGEDITNEFPEDARKERLFLQSLLGIDELMFKNSLCLGEGLRAEWDEWRREAAPKLISGSFLQTADQALIQKAEAVIAQKIEEIGTERAESKPLGQAVAKQQQIKLAIGKEEANEAAGKELCEELERIHGECKEKETSLALRKIELAGHIHSLLKNLELEKSPSEAAATSLNAEDCSFPADFSQEQFQEIRGTLYRRVESCRSLFQERATFVERLESLRPDPDSIGFAARYKQIAEPDLQRIEELDQKLTDDFRNEPVNPEGNEGKVSGWNSSLLLSGVGAILAGGFLTLLGYRAIGIAAAAVGIVLSVASRVAGRNKIRKYQILIKQQQEQKQAEIEKWETELIELLKRFDADTPRQARARWQQILQTRERLSGLEQQMEWVSSEVRKTEERLQAELATVERVFRESGIFDANYQVHLDVDADELELAVEEWETKAKQLLQQIDFLQRISGIQQEISRWQKRLEELDVANDLIRLPDTPLNPRQLEEELRSLEQDERVYLADFARVKELEGRLQSIRQGRVNLVALGRELDYWREQAAKWSAAREALETTKAAFEEIRIALYREQAPRLVQKVSGLAEIFTGGRYSNLRVDGQLDVRVTSPDSGYTYEMSGLSKGTADQLSFALALAVAESVIEEGDRLPLLIDEPFLHYDDQRLEKTMQYLLTKSSQRQILFFTHRTLDMALLRRIRGDGLVVHHL